MANFRFEFSNMRNKDDAQYSTTNQTINNKKKKQNEISK